MKTSPLTVLGMSLTLTILACLNACQPVQAFLPPNRIVASYRCGLARDDDNNNNNNSDGSARVRFSGLELSQVLANPLDSALSFVSSDVASIAIGLLGLCLLLGERLTLSEEQTTPDQLGEETRSNLIAVLACGSVLLNGISKLDVTSALAEKVELEGLLLSKPIIFEESFHSLQWAMESLLLATPAKTVVLLEKDQTDGKSWKVTAMAGAVPIQTTMDRPNVPSSTPILDRFLKEDDGTGPRETYLPTLQALPGKTEFTYIPPNTQEVLILAIPQATCAALLLLGTDRAKSFTPRDRAWCQSVAARLGMVPSSQ